MIEKWRKIGNILPCCAYWERILLILQATAGTVALKVGEEIQGFVIFKIKKIKKLPTWNFKTFRLLCSLEASEEIAWDTSVVLGRILQV